MNQLKEIENNATESNETPVSKSNIRDKVWNIAFVGAMAAGMASSIMPMAFAADASVTQMIKAITVLVKYIGILLGVVYGIFGFLHYAAANAEGDGPGKNKAQNQLAAALMLIAIGVIVGLVKWEDIVGNFTAN